MGLIHVVAVSDEREPVLAAVRELGAEKVILVGPDDETADGLATVLQPLGVDTERRRVEGNMLTGSVQLLQAIVEDHPDRKDDVIVNLGAAGRYQACALLSAAFVAGVRTIDRPEDAIRFLPVLQFSYDEVVGEEKLSILDALADLDAGEGTLNELAQAAGLPSSTVSYQIRGGEDTDGLEPLGLVEVDPQEDGDVLLRLTPMGEQLSRGMRL